MSSIAVVIPAYNNYVVMPMTLDSIYQQDAGINVLIARDGASVAEACNIAIERSMYEYYIVLGGDDYLLPGGISTMHDVLEHYHNAEIAYGNYVEKFVEADGGINNQVVTTPMWTRENMRLGNITSYHIMFRRGLWQRIGGFDPTMPSWEDWEFIARAMARGAKAVKVDYTTFVHCNHPDSKHWQSIARWHRDTMLGWLAKRVPEVFA